MTTIGHLREATNLAFESLLAAIEGVTEPISFFRPTGASEEHLHTDGSIHMIVLHAACVKYMCGSVGFRNTEIRWSQLADRIENFEPNWGAAVEFLNEAHKYWLDLWSHLSDEQLTMEIPTNYGTTAPAWRIIRLVHHHDSYHAGQIAAIRYIATPTTEKPLSQAEDIRQHCKEMIAW
ncbi:MAG: DinB family protein [Fimbriimonadales bacterium]